MYFIVHAQKKKVQIIKDGEIFSTITKINMDNSLLFTLEI